MECVRVRRAHVRTSNRAPVGAPPGLPHHTGCIPAGRKQLRASRELSLSVCTRAMYALPFHGWEDRFGCVSVATKSSTREKSLGARTGAWSCGCRHLLYTVVRAGSSPCAQTLISRQPIMNPMEKPSTDRKPCARPDQVAGQHIGGAAAATCLPPSLFRRIPHTPVCSQ